MKYSIGFIVLGLIVAGLYFAASKENSFELTTNTSSTFPISLRIVKRNSGEVNSNLDIEAQKPLSNPPEEVKGLYLTSWSAGNEKKVNWTIDFIKNKSLNTVVIDIKDYSGYVAFDTELTDVIKYNAKEIRIPKVNALIKKFHDQGIYVIARITFFQDPRLAKARPDLAVQSKSRPGPWKDRKGISWLDPTSKEVWDYDIAIAKEATSRGFDEINFDYIRFPSDGNLADMKFNSWDGKIPKHKVIANFFKYLRSELANAKISADLFGLSTVQADDLGIGQIIEDAYSSFNYVCPMVYPSHYAPGFLGYKNPANYPYEVVKYSLENAVKKYIAYNEGTEPIPLMATSTQTATVLQAVSSTSPHHDKTSATLRPWLQAFDLGATYNHVMIEKQIKAVEEVLDNGSTRSMFGGWLLWDPSNNYKEF